MPLFYQLNEITSPAWGGGGAASQRGLQTPLGRWGLLSEGFSLQLSAKSPSETQRKRQGERRDCLQTLTVWKQEAVWTQHRYILSPCHAFWNRRLALRRKRRATARRQQPEAGGGPSWPPRRGADAEGPGLLGRLFRVCPSLLTPPHGTHPLSPSQATQPRKQSGSDTASLGVPACHRGWPCCTQTHPVLLQGPLAGSPLFHITSCEGDLRNPEPKGKTKGKLIPYSDLLP